MDIDIDFTSERAEYDTDGPRFQAISSRELTGDEAGRNTTATTDRNGNIHVIHKPTCEELSLH